VNITQLLDSCCADAAANNIQLLPKHSCEQYPAADIVADTIAAKTQLQTESSCCPAASRTQLQTIPSCCQDTAANSIQLLSSCCQDTAANNTQLLPGHSC
jgi:hypothetical protein